MLEKIYQSLNIKPVSPDEYMQVEIVKKAKNHDPDKRPEDNFTLMLEEKMIEERNLQLLNRKAKKHDENAIMLIPAYNNLPITINNNNLVKLGKDKKNRCSRCGNIVDASETVEVNLDKKNTAVCSKCMNQEISDFLTYNYL
jgi:hypothetical protein